VLSSKVISFLAGKNSSRMIAPSNFIRLGGDFDFPLIEEIHQGRKKGTFLEGMWSRSIFQDFQFESVEVRDQ